ncbi:DNA ligase 1 [Lucilia sericata]|uniref:DNA ligase 1 n=1 Tax=Lucilia sericata TaxID=13632 RepID=UPI0018A8260F|nr:DNA ligase 1 [Lucilia sericata]
MKRKFVKPTNVPEEESSEDYDSDIEAEEEESVVDSEEEEIGESDEHDSEIGTEEGSVVDSEEEEADESDEEALDASDTESDEDGSDIEDNKPPKSRREIVKEEIMQRYQERQGKQLYIRFPHKVPETQEALEAKIKELTPLVVKVHKPRQRYVRFCLVDFATNEDRNTALKELKKSIKNGTLEKYVVNIPRTESSEFVSELAERKLKSVENKKAKLRLKKASRKALTENHFTSSIIVLNLPKTASALEVRELFPGAVDINIKPSKGKMYKDKSVAAITLPTTLDARNAVKKKLSLGGNQLIIKFDNQKLKKKSKKFNKKVGLKPVTDKTEVKNIEESEPKENQQKLEATPDKATNGETLARKVPVKKLNKNEDSKPIADNIEVKNEKDSEPKVKQQKLEVTPTKATVGKVLVKKGPLNKNQNNKFNKNNGKNTPKKVTK